MITPEAASSGIHLIYTNNTPLRTEGHYRSLRRPSDLACPDVAVRPTKHRQPIADLSDINGYPEEKLAALGHQPTPLFPETDLQITEDR